MHRTVRRLAGVVLVVGTLFVAPFSARAQDAASVEIHDNYFSPAEIHVPEGGTVTWTNLGGSHSVTSDDGVSFDSSPSCSTLPLAQCMASGDTFQHQFRIPETIAYHCRIHGSAMVGKVVVDAAPTTTSTSTSTTLESTTTTTGADSSSTTIAGDQSPFVTQGALPSLPPASHVALPNTIIRSKQDDELRPWVIADVVIAGTTTLVGIALVRRGRVPFG
jgi:plastocyanin